MLAENKRKAKEVNTKLKREKTDTEYSYTEDPH
jgi:hypothetical protein